MAPVWEGLAGFVDAALEHWREPDQGIWEVRGEPKHFIASKVMCWVAADRGAASRANAATSSAPSGGGRPPTRSRPRCCAKGVDDAGVFRSTTRPTTSTPRCCCSRSWDSCPADDERVKATVLAIADELTEDGLVLRYRVEQADDGLSRRSEGTFTICSFWLVSALAMIGETERARALFEKLLSFAGPLLLYAEEIDTTTGQHLGNFPQAFTHLALIDAGDAAHRGPKHGESVTARVRIDVVVVGGGFGGLPACRFLGHVARSR